MIPKISLINLITLFCNVISAADFMDHKIRLNEKCFHSLSDGTACENVHATNLGNFSLFLPKILFGTKCCHDDQLGCFTNTQGTPFECMPYLPECMAIVKPEFQFFYYNPSSENSKNNYKLVNFFDLDKSILRIGAFVGYRELYVLIHGFGNEWPKSWLTPMKDHLLSAGKNVLVVKWTGGSQDYSSFLNYFKAASNARSVGAALARVLNSLVVHRRITLLRTTIVGYSLGAHVAGFTGQRLPGIRKIIGLDPAGPLFTCQNPIVRLDPTDAKFVEILHTNGESLLKGGVGTMQKMGHADYYVAGGRIQPGCKRKIQHNYATVTQLLFSTSWHDVNFWCSHKRAVEVFTESIENLSDKKYCHFEAYHCHNESVWDNGDCLLQAYNTFSKPNRYQLNNLYNYHGTFYFNTRPLQRGEKLCGKKSIAEIVAKK